MNFSIRPLDRSFAGEVTGVDLQDPLSPEAVASIEAGMDRYAVLVFRGQDISDEQQLAFSRNFGLVESSIGGNITRPDQRRLNVDFADVSNLDESHRIYARDDRYDGCGQKTSDNKGYKFVKHSNVVSRQSI